MKLATLLKSPTLKASVITAALLGLQTPAIADDHLSKAPEDAKVYFISPKDGAKIKGDVKVVFGLSGMGVAPAGTMKDKTGHHHLLIDVDQMPDMTMPLPSTAQVKHFGGGQTETTLSLPKGKHTLQLVLGNYAHIPHDKPVMSEKITITVK